MHKAWQHLENEEWDELEKFAPMSTPIRLFVARKGNKGKKTLI